MKRLTLTLSAALISGAAYGQQLTYAQLWMLEQQRQNQASSAQFQATLERNNQDFQRTLQMNQQKLYELRVIHAMESPKTIYIYPR